MTDPPSTYVPVRPRVRRRWWHSRGWRRVGRIVRAAGVWLAAAGAAGVAAWRHYAHMPLGHTVALSAATGLIILGGLASGPPLPKESRRKAT